MTINRKQFRSRPNEAVLTNGDIELFALNGYVVKCGVLDGSLLERAEDLMWEALGENFDRDDSLTWRSVAADCAGSIAVSDRYGKVKLREAVWGQPALDALMTQNLVVFAMVERLLGAGNVLPPVRSRGLYPTFPTPVFRSTPMSTCRRFRSRLAWWPTLTKFRRAGAGSRSGLAVTVRCFPPAPTTPQRRPIAGNARSRRRSMRTSLSRSQAAPAMSSFSITS